MIAGHGRVLAATQLGLTEAPVIVLGHLTDAQRRAYRIADNKLAVSPRDEALLNRIRGGLIGLKMPRAMGALDYSVHRLTAAK